jgi:hypothetical protein
MNMLMLCSDLCNSVISYEQHFVRGTPHGNHDRGFDRGLIVV